MAQYPFFRLEVKGYRDVKGRYAKRSTEARTRMRDGIKDVSRSMVQTLQHYAPEDTGLFAAGIRYRTSWEGDLLRSTLFATGEHAFVLPFLVGGTQPHPIPIGGSAAQLAKGYPLHWVDKGGVDHFAWSVWHPGTFPDPFVSLAIDAMAPQFDMALRTVARHVAWVQ